LASFARLPAKPDTLLLTDIGPLLTDMFGGEVCIGDGELPGMPLMISNAVGFFTSVNSRPEGYLQDKSL
jgi:hypothetical protein